VFVFAFSRFHLVNWVREFFLWVFSIGLSFLIYEGLIKNKLNLLPELSDLKNQFWILLIMFIYSAFNQLDFSQQATVRRKQNYLNIVYLENKQKYGAIVSTYSIDVLLESFIYSVLLYENFNRPRFVRVIEKITFPWFSKSLGPMQVQTNMMITDADSVRTGAERIMKSYLNALDSAKEKAREKEIEFDPFKDNSHRQYVLYKISSAYNKDDEYLNGIMEMHSEVIEQLYPSLKFNYPHWSESLI